MFTLIGITGAVPFSQDHGTRSMTAGNHVPERVVATVWGEVVQELAGVGIVLEHIVDCAQLYIV